MLLGSLAAPVLPIDLTPRRKDDPQRAKPDVTLGRLPVARRDMEQLRRLLALQPKLTDPKLPPRQQQMVLHRGAFADALTWLEMHGDGADALGRWRALAAGGGRWRRGESGQAATAVAARQAPAQQARGGMISTRRAARRSP